MGPHAGAHDPAACAGGCTCVCEGGGGGLQRRAAAPWEWQHASRWNYAAEGFWVAARMNEATLTHTACAAHPIGTLNAPHNTLIPRVPRYPSLCRRRTSSSASQTMRASRCGRCCVMPPRARCRRCSSQRQTSCGRSEEAPVRGRGPGLWVDSGSFGPLAGCLFVTGLGVRHPVYMCKELDPEFQPWMRAVSAPSHMLPAATATGCEARTDLHISTWIGHFVCLQHRCAFCWRLKQARDSHQVTHWRCVGRWRLIVC